MKPLEQVFIYTVVTLTVVLSQNHNDESRPYEFGFTIDGEQHRYEKKDQSGIIQGEFGFITADGIYHVTVYATDENGRFKILSTRNIRISAPLDGSPATGPISPDAAKYLGKQKQIGGPSPAPKPPQGPQKYVQSPQQPPRQNHQIQPSNLPQPQVITDAPRVYEFTTQSTIKPACGGCGYVTTPKPGTGTQQGFPFQTPSFQKPASGVNNFSPAGGSAGGVSVGNIDNGIPSGNSVSNGNGIPGGNTAFGGNAGGLAGGSGVSGGDNAYGGNAAGLAGGVSGGSSAFGGNTGGLAGGSGVSGGNNAYGGNAVGLVGGVPGGISTPGDNGIPSGGIQSAQAFNDQGQTAVGFQRPPVSSQYQNIQDQLNHPSGDLLPPGSNEPYQGVSNGHLQGTTLQAQHVDLNQQYQGGNAPNRQSFGNVQRPGTTGGADYPPIQLGPNPPPPSREAVSKLPPVTVSDKTIHVGGSRPLDIPIKDKYPGMVDGLPDGIEEKDIKDLLYKFHYTVGFHGHYEKGLKNGAKIGGYFVNGRDGISRVVTYVADENGYRPKFKFINLGLDSPDTPKEGSEKKFGLKSFEFVWYPVE